jgi:benzil reductase ((S)-benzoin forming)
MRSHFFITGTTSGLGRALTKLFLENPNNIVFGISRTQVNQHERYRHLRLDLSERAFPFFPFEMSGADELILINNAGWIGPILPLGEQEDEDIDTAFGVNLVAPVILMNRFLKQTKEFSGRRVILNISSGAAYNPIESWSTYCASKAGIDMISKVVKQEQSNLEIFSVAPGIVDTAMQREIRSGNPDKFPAHKRFMEYFNNGELMDPDLVAKKIQKILTPGFSSEEVVVSVRNILEP